MKHNRKITIIILLMFILAQFIGLFVINSYTTQKIVDGKIVNATGKVMPYGMGFQENNSSTDLTSILISVLFSLIIAISLIFILIKIKAKAVMKTWFFVVSVLAIGISLTAFLPEIKYASIISLLIAIPLAVFKIYKRNIVVHNLTELLIYPGIAAIFVPILNLTILIVLLILISAYDMWAVWKSKIMQKIAKYQIEELNVVGGLFIPYASKKVKEKINLLKTKFKSKEKLEKEFKKSELKVNLAILGGGDIAYSILSAGVVLETWGLIPALITVGGASIALVGLLVFGRKKTMYPAMPFITGGIFLVLLFNWLFII